MGDTIPKRRYRIEKVEPDGGWGYLIGIGMAVPFVTIEFQN